MGAVDTTYTFTATDTITSSKMNNIIDQTTMTPSAIIGTTLEVASGQLKVRAQGITSNEMGTSSVTTDAIANNAVTPAKFSAGGPSWNSVTGTLNISQPQVEVGTGITINTASLIDFHSVHPLTDYDARIIRYSGTNGGLTIQNTGSGGILLDSPNGVDFAGAKMPNPVGNAPLYGTRAWVNFYGVGAVGANMTIRGQGNVSSVNKLGTGRYRVTFATAMPDANYATITGSDANSPHKIAGVISQTAAYVDIAYSQINTSTARDDPDWGQVTIIR